MSKNFEIIFEKFQDLNVIICNDIYIYIYKLKFNEETESSNKNKGFE